MAGSPDGVLPGWSRSRAVDALEGNAWSMWSIFGKGPDSTLIDTPEVLAYETPLDHVPYNAVFRFRVDDERADAALEEVLAPYRARDVPLMWLVHPTARPADLRERLQHRGLVLAEEIAGMIGDIGTLEPPPTVPEGTEVSEGTVAEVSDWMQLISWRYDLGTDSSSYLENVYSQAIGAADRSTRWWVARRDGIPVSKVALHIGAGVAGIYGVATRPEARGMGLAGILTCTALGAAQQEGLQVAILHATPMAAGLYRRLGFVDVATFEIWAEPGRLHL